MALHDKAGGTDTDSGWKGDGIVEAESYPMTNLVDDLTVHVKVSISPPTVGQFELSSSETHFAFLVTCRATKRVITIHRVESNIAMFTKIFASS
jgi:Tfp pilus assembly protein FimT